VEKGDKNPQENQSSTITNGNVNVKVNDSHETNIGQGTDGFD
jgi:hypothetical protein